MRARVPFCRLAALGLMLAVLPAPPMRAQNDPAIPASPPINPEEPPADTDVGRPGIKVSPNVYTPILWSKGAGFGIGVGAEIKNVGLVGSSVIVQIAPAQHRGQYGLWYLTKSAYGPGLSALGGVFYEANEHVPYYGVGPASKEANKLHLHRRLFESEARVTYGFGARGRLRAGVFGRYQQHAGIRTENVDPGARSRLDARSEAALQASLSDPKAISAGAEALYDSRSNLFNPRKGVLVQAGTMRTMHAGGASFAPYWQRYGTVNWFVPLTLETSLMVRAIVVDSDARDGTPSVLLPVLDSGIGAGLHRNRFVTNDFLYLSGEYTKTLFDLFGTVAADGVLSGHLYGAYDRLSQFTPSITFASPSLDARDHFPLRPAAGVGLRFYSYFLETTILNVTLGVSRERIGLHGFSIVSDLRSTRPALRGR
jgi:hypothetical protein